MRALQLTGWGRPPELREVPDPEPGPGEVSVRIGGAGACHSDLHLMDDVVDGLVPWTLPFTLGHENAGWVQATGPGVVGLEEGQPVAVYGAWGCGRCRRCLVGADNYCERAAELPGAGGGLGRMGGMAETLIVPSARYLVPLSGLDPVDAAPLTDAGLTPYHAVKRSLPLLVPGSSAVVIGAGGLGHLAVQILAALSPTSIIVVDQREEALRRATDHGAHHAVPAGEQAAGTIRELTRGAGADLVLDLVGVDATIALAAATVRLLGQATIVGIGGGSWPFSFFGLPYEASLATTYWGSLSELAEVLALGEAGHVRAEVTRFDLADAPGAYQAMRSGTLHGRAVVVP